LTSTQKSAILEISFQNCVWDRWTSQLPEKGVKVYRQLWIPPFVLLVLIFSALSPPSVASVASAARDLKLPSAVVLSFFDHCCDGQWQAGVVGQWPASLPCPGSEADKSGFVRPLGPSFQLEDDSTAVRSFETHPTLEQGQPDSYISGSFSLAKLEVILQQGDRFKAKVGFLHGAELGRVRFTVKYDSDPVEPGDEVELIRINDNYDGQLRDINVDLSAFAGQRGGVILRVDSLGSWSQDRAVWVDPRIERGTAPPPSPTFTPSPSPTPIPTHTPTPTHTPIPTPTPTPTRTPTPIPTPTRTPTSTPTPTRTPTISPTPTPKPTATGKPTPQPPSPLPPAPTTLPTSTPTPTPPPRKPCACSEAERCDARLTALDGFAVGNLTSGKAQTVIAVDDDAGGDDGRFYLYYLYEHYGWSEYKHFDARFTKWDRVAIGDVMGGDGIDEIVVAVDDDQKVYIYNDAGELLQELGAVYSDYDSLAIGNVLGGDEEEIVIAVDQDQDQVYIYNTVGTASSGFQPGMVGGVVIQGFDFNGSPYLDAEHGHNDGLVVGNVLGDEYDEIILLDQHGDDSLLYIYDGSGTLLMVTRVSYTTYDALAVGDVVGDEREEILIAVDQDTAIYIYDAIFGLCKVIFAPRVTRADALATGDILGGPKEEILLAVDDDDRVFVFGGN
jgi:hypothetical protein